MSLKIFPRLVDKSGIRNRHKVGEAGGRGLSLSLALDGITLSHASYDGSMVTWMYSPPTPLYQIIMKLYPSLDIIWY